MLGIALVIDAVNVIMRHLEELPAGPEASELRERGLGYINEAVLWQDARPRPSVQTREALMKKVLALHVAVNKLAAQGDGTARFDAKAIGPARPPLPAEELTSRPE